MRQRRFLPSLSQLIALEAVMRHRSVTAAADELSLTQSTVSRLIAALEDQLGKPLFLRQRKRLIPTAEALVYAAHITQGLDLIQRASMGLIANPGGGTLSLSVLPTFATRWLAPRIGQFLSDNPGISVNLSTKIQRVSLATGAFDAAIYFGQGDWPDAHHMRLFDERLTACAAPGFLARHPVTGTADMAGLPMLQLETRPHGWQAWFAAQGGGGVAVRGMVMDQFSMMIQSAIAGLGVALLPSYLAEPEIAEGRLLPLLRPAVPGDGAYWLAWPDRHQGDPAFLRFRTWIAAQVRAAFGADSGDGQPG
ncbi:LysR substrate-binding domain-containing protein [Paracoccus nototheniae]|uniref:LysR substrate-binding domain-containing protein n=1 Tax=Paracoccus nototheniae TaxID=2489002 RepID=A0ABW4DPQ4_9RHOB|nr:LysR substrate-binding domain-containing protein [Paracoccus nototheniae]